MDKRGSGFDKIVNGTNRLFKDNENHVEFYATEIYFSVVIYNANYHNTENDLINGLINGPINGPINDNEKIIYMLMKQNPQITIAGIVEKTGISNRTVKRVISSLKEKELIVREGSNKGGYWKIIN